MIEGPPPGLWDSFWANHASSDNLYHRLLWLVRFLFSSAYAHRIARVSGTLKSARLLEIGCGSARTLHYLDGRYIDSSCFALDLSLKAIQLVHQISPNFHSTIGNAFYLPLIDSYFDVLFSIGLIEHFSRQQAFEIMQEKIRVTRTGGLVGVVVPWKSSIYNLIVRKAFGRHWPFGEENPFRRKELANFLESLGLQDIQIIVIFGTTLIGIGTQNKN